MADNSALMWLIFGFVVVGAIIQNTKIDFQSAGATIVAIGIAALVVLHRDR